MQGEDYMWQRIGLVNRRVIVYMILTFFVVGICIGLIIAQKRDSKPVEKNGAVFVEKNAGGRYEYKV